MRKAVRVVRYGKYANALSLTTPSSSTTLWTRFTNGMEINCGKHNTKYTSSMWRIPPSKQHQQYNTYRHTQVHNIYRGQEAAIGIRNAPQYRIFSVFCVRANYIPNQIQINWRMKWFVFQYWSGWKEKTKTKRRVAWFAKCIRLDFSSNICTHVRIGFVPKHVTHNLSQSAGHPTDTSSRIEMNIDRGRTCTLGWAFVTDRCSCRQLWWWCCCCCCCYCYGLMMGMGKFIH